MSFFLKAFNTHRIMFSLFGNLSVSATICLLLFMRKKQKSFFPTEYVTSVIADFCTEMTF